MKRGLDQWATAALLIAFAVYLAWFGATVAAEDGFHSLRLFAAAASSASLAVFVVLGLRWARWIAIGWSLDVVANLLAAIFFDGYTSSRPSFMLWFSATIVGGAIVILVLLGRPAARRRFEPDWTTPLHHAYRWTAISVATCATHAVVAGMFALERGDWDPVLAAVLMLVAIALLTGGRVLGLAVGAAALIAYGATKSVAVPHLSVPGQLTTAGGSDAWCFFLGAASSVAWIPALVISLGACALAAPQLAKRYLSRTGAMVMLLFAGVGLTFGAVAIAKRYTAERDDEEIRAAVLRHRLATETSHEASEDPRCLVLQRLSRPSNDLLRLARKLETNGPVFPGPDCLGKPDQTVILDISGIERPADDLAVVTVEGWCRPACGLGGSYRLKRDGTGWRVIDTKVLWAG